MSRMSLEEAKKVLRNRGYMPTPTGRSEWVVFKDNKTVAGSFTGRELVKYAKEIISKDGFNQITTGNEELIAELRANFEPGQKVINVITGEEIQL